MLFIFMAWLVTLYYFQSLVYDCLRYIGMPLVSHNIPSMHKIVDGGKLMFTSLSCFQKS